MQPNRRIEQGLERALTFATGSGRPAKLGQAMRYAVFPGGARIRARLCLAVAAACGAPDSRAAQAAATAVELLHCASLVHDDLPCFDDADLRRGKPTVHLEFGVPIALLTGDALIVLAFETLARECADEPRLIGPLCATIGRAVGMPNGIVAGQGWESEEDIPLAEYHRAKTSALFAGAAASGAICAGADPLAWLAFADALGAAYQIADDLRDEASDVSEIGKPAGQDLIHNRPNAARAAGVKATLATLHETVGRVINSIPPCEGADILTQLIMAEAKRLVPVKLAISAA